MVIRQEMESKIALLSHETEVLHDEQENTTLALNKAKSEPIRFAKNADILKKAIGMMEADLNKAKNEEANVEAELEKLRAETERLQKENEFEQEDLAHDITQHDQLQKKGDEIVWQKRQAAEVEKQLRNHLVECEVELKSVQDATRREGDSIQDLGKTLYKLKKEYKKIEQYKKQMSTQLNDINQQMQEAEERQMALEEEKRRQSSIKMKLKAEVTLIKDKRIKSEEYEKEKEGKLEEKMKKIEQAEKDAQRARDEENELNRKMEWLGLQREHMARKASQNIAQARETSEELKIKELLLIDLKKKNQETQMKLKSYIAMYDEVKNARNKYVKLIQNSSQELAETKERIKILQNEVEILRNESAEKDRKLKEERHHVQVSLHVRDTLRTDINKLEYQVKQKHSLMTQQVNEINKLNVIINSLEKEMINLKEKYEQVCESRNYTGIQLIDRNDELCILYEKANIQEAIQKRGENEIRGKDDEIRMLHLELSEVKRQIEVHMKQIPQVPELSAQVLALRSELDDVKAKEKELALQLEDPDNLKRFRELKGEDPDEEALEAKIQVLEERLNNKKEQLLEKELVLEEITTLADKLRSQALTGRQGTLELSERVNDFQSRIKILTRRMMATVSELSMFQATAIKLQQEKDKIEHQLQEAYSRIDSTLPPTDECQYEWERMEKHRLIKEEEHKLRKELEEEERLLPGQITRTTAEPRHNAYIPEGDRLGLPKPYGPLRPFYPSELGANTRHIRKPQPKPIEI
jgi:chromosome segregation ATPase